MTNSGVHRTHCCVMHGCKYGDEDCPVVTGEIVQDYECEYCEDWYINFRKVYNKGSIDFYLGKFYFGSVYQVKDKWFALINHQSETEQQFDNKFAALNFFHEYLTEGAE